jgi:hypothetical protein
MAIPEKPNHHQDTATNGFHQSGIPQSSADQNMTSNQTEPAGQATITPDLEADNNDAARESSQNARIDMGKEAGLDYTVNHSLAESLKVGDKRTANYLIHRMLWDQQEKLDLDDIATSQDGTMEVQDEF